LRLDRTVPSTVPIELVKRVHHLKQIQASGVVVGNDVVQVSLGITSDLAQKQIEVFSGFDSRSSYRTLVVRGSSHQEGVICRSRMARSPPHHSMKSAS
jgi:hypothetical protein